MRRQQGHRGVAGVVAVPRAGLDPRPRRVGVEHRRHRVEVAAEERLEGLLDQVHVLAAHRGPGMMPAALQRAAHPLHRRGGVRGVDVVGAVALVVLDVETGASVSRVAGLAREGRPP